MITIDQIQLIITWLAPIITGCVTTVVIPLLIRKGIINKLDGNIDKICAKTETHDQRLFEELREMRKDIDIMRGKAPRD